MPGALQLGPCCIVAKLLNVENRKLCDHSRGDHVRTRVGLVLVAMGHGVIKDHDRCVSLRDGVLQQGPYFSLPFILPE